MYHWSFQRLPRRHELARLPAAAPVDPFRRVLRGGDRGGAVTGELLIVCNVEVNESRSGCLAALSDFSSVPDYITGVSNEKTFFMESCCDFDAITMQCVFDLVVMLSVFEIFRGSLP